MSARDFNDDQKDAGDLGPGTVRRRVRGHARGGSRGSVESVDALKYQRVEPAVAEGGELMTVKLRHKLPGGETSALITGWCAMAGSGWPTARRSASPAR
ncbi:MAG: DUF3520 domain-containing protein [bacterium]